MKVCISATEGNMNAEIDPRFGRATYFIIVDTETNKHEIVDNSANAQAGGAGIKSAQTIIDKGAEALITGKLGPNAFEAVSAAKIKVYSDVSMTISEALEKFSKGTLSKTDMPNSKAHSGMQ